MDELTIKKLPSISKILDYSTDKKFLEIWKNNVGEENANIISNNSKNRGTVMHQLFEYYTKIYKAPEITYNTKLLQNSLNISLDDIKDNCIREAIHYTLKNGLEGFKDKNITEENIEIGKSLFLKLIKSNFLKDLKDFIGSEINIHYIDPVTNFGYKGRLDLVIGTLFNDVIVIDLKTSTKSKKEEWILNYFKQTAAYCMAYYQMNGKYPKGKIAIALEEGEYQIFEMTKIDIKKYFDLFMLDVNKYYTEIINNNSL